MSLVLQLEIYNFHIVLSKYSLVDFFFANLNIENVCYTCTRIYSFLYQKEEENSFTIIDMTTNNMYLQTTA